MTLIDNGVEDKGVIHRDSFIEKGLRAKSHINKVPPYS